MTILFIQNYYQSGSCRKNIFSYFDLLEMSDIKLSSRARQLLSITNLKCYTLLSQIALSFFVIIYLKLLHIC